MALTLTRRQGESIYIGQGDDRVMVKVNLIRGNQVRLSFEAAPHIPIVRSELVAKGGK